MRKIHNYATDPFAASTVLSTATVGTGGNYATLKAAFDAINAGTLTGPITLQVISSTTETVMATLNSSGTGFANYSSVLIYPTGTGYAISGSVSNPLINLNGADNVVIDGRVNATGTAVGLALTNTNTSSAASTVRYINAAENNTVKYTTVSGSGASASTAIIYFISSAAGNGNSNNVVEYNNITNAGGNRPQNAILSYGTAGRENTGIIIRYNNFYNFLSESNNAFGINISGNSTDWFITGNSFYETAALVPTGAYNYSPGKVSTASMHTVAGNYIGGSQPLCGGTPWTMTSSYATYFSGIFINGNTTTATLVQNNTIANFNCSSTSANPWDGIYVAAGNATLSGNTVGAGTGTNSIVVTTLNASATATVTGGVITAINLIGGGSGFAVAPTISFSLSGATTAANVTATISGGVVTGFNIIDGGAGYTAIPIISINGAVYSTTHGIRYLNSAAVLMENNTIGAITTFGNSTYSHGFEAIVISGLATSVVTVKNNLIGSLTTTASIRTGSASASSVVKEDLRGIFINSSINSATISGNTIANLTNTYTGSFTSKVDGICSNGVSNIIQNNTIRNLTSAASSVAIRGIQQTASLPDGNQTITGNTVYNLSNTHATAPVVVMGIDYSGATTGNNFISGNFIYGLTIASSNVNSEIDGILLGNGVTTTSNNIINIGAGVATGYRMYGISDNSSNNTLYNNNIYFNTVYISGTVASGVTSTTAALYNANNTSIRNYRNNIFVNARSGGTSGKHYAIRVAGIQGLTINYNDYYVGAGGILGSFASSDKTTLAAWKAATVQDANSLNTTPLFTVAGGNVPTNYYTSAILPAATGTGITADYTGLGRSSLPKMGALEVTDYVWSGATSTNFSTASNWQNGLVPTNGSDISFAVSPTNNCILDQDRSLRHIANAQGTYKLLLNGYKLTLTGNLTFTNNAKIDATATSSVVEFAGAAAQSLPAGALVSNTADGLTVNNAIGLTLNNDITVAQPLTLSSGIVTLGAHTLTLNGILTATAGTLLGGSTSNIIIGGTGTATLPAVSLNNLTVNRTTGITLAGPVTILGTLALTAGTVTVGANTLTFSGSSPTRVNGTIDVSDADATLAFTNAAAITLPTALFTGNVSNLTINGTGGVTSGGNFTLTGILNLQSANPSATKGALDLWNGTSARTLTMGGNATTTGTGDTTGIIKRTNISAGPSYTFGNQFMKVSFANTGTLPSQISLKISIGATLSWRPGAIQRDVEVIQTGSANTSAVVTYHYLDSELNGNDDSKLVLWAKINDLEYGASSFDSDDNWVSLSNVNLAFFASSFDGLKNITLDEYSTTNTLTWNGSLSTSWTSIENWTPNAGPSSTKTIVIPDAGTTPNDPVLPSITEVKTVLIEEGGILNAVPLAQLTLDGTSAWINYGTFNANTSTVVFNNAGGTIAGSTNFNNISINTGKSLSMTDGSILRIAGAVTNNGTWSAVSSGPTYVEYNGAAQTVVNPNGTTPGYYNLILSGSGTKTMAPALLAINGDFTLAGTASATAASAFAVNGNLEIGEGTTFGSGNFNHVIKGNFNNNGTFTAAANRIINLNGTIPQSILGTATTTFDRLTISNGDVTLYSNINVVNLLSLTSGTLNVAAATLGISGTITKTSGFIGVDPASSLTIGGSGALALAADLFSTAPVLNNFTVNRTGGVTLGQDMEVEGVLSLTSGTLTLGTSNFTMGAAGTIAVASPGVAKMIVASSSGELRKILTVNTPFTYPIGDDTGTLQYSPVTLTLADDNTENNYFGVKVTNDRHPDNASTANYLNRYWSISRTGATPHTVYATATYTAADVTGAETAVAAALLTGTFNQLNNPWAKYSALSGNTLVAPAMLVSSGQTTVFTGIRAASPTVTIAGAGTYCGGSDVSLQALATADGTVLYNWSPPTFLSNTAIYNPVATNVTATTTYTVSIKDGNGLDASATGTVTVGNTTTWTGTWSNGVPTDNLGVIIAANYTAAASFACCSLTVNNNAVVTIPAGITVTLHGALTVASGSLTFENNAALVQLTDAVNTDNIIFHKDSNPLFRLDYTLWSAPVTGQTLRQFSMGTSNNRFYEYAYDTADNGITYDEGYWPVDPLTTYFEPGKGYLIRVPNSITANVTGTTGSGVTIPADYASGTGNYIFDGAFTGIPNNGSYTPALNQLGNQYTAVGNPYPSPVSVADFLSANSTKLVANTGIWFWRKRNNTASQSYVTLNLLGYTENPDDASTDNSTGLGSFYQGNSNTWLIAPGQGFFVQAQANLAQPTLSFTNTMRRNSPGAQAFFRSAQDAASRYWLNMAAENGGASQALVGYTAQGTTGIDYGYDSKAFASSDAVSFYSIANDSRLTIQARPQFEVSDVVPMGFVTPTAGQYTIHIDHTDGLFGQGQNIYLKDLQEGLIRNLSENDYTFATEAGTFEGRFEVHYQTAALGNDTPVIDANTVIVVKQGNTITINTGNTLMSSIKVFDIRGRELYSRDSVNAAETVISNLSIQQQVLIIEIATEKGIVNKRIIY